MRTSRNETQQPAHKKKIEDSYYKYLSLAQEAQKKDQVLSESYYQLAEYYLHSMNEPSNSLDRSRHSFAKKPGTPPQDRKASHSSEDTVILPFRGSFLRRNRRGMQRREED